MLGGDFNGLISADDFRLLNGCLDNGIAIAVAVVKTGDVKISGGDSELSVLRQVLKHAKMWYGFAEDYTAVKNTKPPAGQALTDADQARLFEVAEGIPRGSLRASRRSWTFSAACGRKKSSAYSGSMCPGRTVACPSAGRRRRRDGETIAQRKLPSSAARAAQMRRATRIHRP
jgi:hypothetical protein